MRGEPLIGVDHLPAVQHAPGVGRYVRELVRALVRLEDGPRLALLDAGLGPRPMAGAPLGLAGYEARFVRRRLPVPRRALDLLARVGLGADRLLGGPALVHRVHPEHPPVSRGVRTTLAVAELPEVGTPADAALGRGAARAAAVVVFDRTFGAALAARYALDPARVHAVPVGCEHWERDLAGEVVARRDPPELLVLGAIRAAREPERVLAAFEALLACGTRAALRFVGRPGDRAPAFRAALARSSARAHVRWDAEPDEATLPRVVAGATALVHLSRSEGSPVTPLEACRLGPAVVASGTPVFRAVLGDAARWVESGDDPRTLAEHFARALADGADQAGRDARRRLAAPFTWEASARAHVAAWRRILSDDATRPPSRAASPRRAPTSTP